MADLAIIYDSVDIKGFEALPFKRDPIWVVGKTNHPLFTKHLKTTAIQFKETLDYEHISFHEGGVLDELVSEARRKTGRTPSHDIKVIRVNSLFKFVEAGLGLGIIGERYLMPFMKKSILQALPIADDWASRNLVWVYPRGQAASPTVRKFLKYLGEKNF